MLKKFTSRKFIACLMGIITGIFLIVYGESVEGTTTLISSIVTYCVAEGYVDSQAAKDVAANVGASIGKEPENDKLF